MKLATYRSEGRDKVALVHASDTRLFDLASASERAGKGCLTSRRVKLLWTYTNPARSDMGWVWR